MIITNVMDHITLLYSIYVLSGNLHLWLFIFVEFHECRFLVFEVCRYFDSEWLLVKLTWSQHFTGYAWRKSWLYLSRISTHPASFLCILYHAIKCHVVSGVVKKKNKMANYAIISCSSGKSFYVIAMRNFMIINDVFAVEKDFVLSLSPKLIKVDRLHLHF